MRILPASPEAIDEALRVLAQGGVVGHATETCYGFACDLTNQAAVATLFLVKQRPTSLPVSGLFSSVEEAKNYVEWNASAEELAVKFLPGPLTIILPIRNDASHRLFPTSAGGKTLGVRISSHPLAQELAKKFGKPITTSSANVHGQPNPYSVADIQSQFRHAEHFPDLLLDSGVLAPTPPSTVINLTGSGGILRKGDTAPHYKSEL